VPSSSVRNTPSGPGVRCACRRRCRRRRGKDIGRAAENQIVGRVQPRHRDRARTRGPRPHGPAARRSTRDVVVEGRRPRMKRLDHSGPPSCSFSDPMRKTFAAEERALRDSRPVRPAGRTRHQTPGRRYVRLNSEAGRHTASGPSTQSFTSSGVAEEECRVPQSARHGCSVRRGN